MFSMTDLLGAVLIALFIAGASYSAIGSGFSKSKLGATEQDITSLRMQTQKLFANSGGSGYSGLTNAGAISAGIVPKSLIKAGDIRHTWGGPVTLSENADNVSFLIELQEIPHDACVELAHFQTDDWYGVSVNGSTIEPGTEVMDVVANCTTGNNNTVIFEAR
jgi:hypothetical protein